MSPKIAIEDEMKQSYLDYSMSVIVGRALPDVRDGLKPVHRRILFAMQQMGMFHNKPFKKCARIVGEVLGKYHPHGDMAVYDALVRMVQPFSLRYPLINGHGNFGCFTKDTKIALTDGRNLSFGELIEEHKKGKKNFTYTINSERLIGIAEIKNPRLTKKKEKIMKVILDNGKEIRCTPDHRFMLRNGIYREAQKLKAGNSLMPLYLKLLTEKDKFKPALRVKDTILLNRREDVYDITIEKTHNFALASGIFVHNSQDGDRAAAMRYSEARLSKLSEEMLQDIEKNTVRFVPNFDGSLEEPLVLPTKLPNLLINGSSGIAVGMATNMAPHNITEVIDAVTAAIENPEIDIPHLMQIIKGPDFPTAGIIIGKKEIENAYLHGRGKIKLRARAEIKESSIVISEIPYMVNKSLLLEGIAELVRNGRITGIKDLRDESDRKGMSIVIKLKKEANPEIVLNQLFKHTRMQTTFGINMLALVNNEPRILNLKQLIQHHINHRKSIVRKRTEFDLNKAQKKAHIFEGIIIALDNLDKTILIIKKSKSVETARKELLANFKLSKEQAQAILDMKLQRLTSLETEKTRKEHSGLLKLIEELKSILASEQKILNIIKEELKELKEKYRDSRRTEILEKEETAFEMEQLILPEDVVVTITHSGYIKRIPVKTYRQQRRGGRGVMATAKKEEDFVEDLFIANTHDYMLFFTNKGRVHWLKVYGIPEGARTAKGKSMINILKLAKDEKITAFIPVKEFHGNLVMVTKKGIIKKTPLTLFSRPRRGGIIALNLDSGDELVSVKHVKANEHLLIGTRQGMAVKFRESDLRAIGRTARGVRGIKLKKADDYVVGMVVAQDEKTLLTITGNGYGKRTPIADYRLIKRGGSGVINIKCTEKNGKVIAVKSVTERDQIMLITRKGIAIRIPVKDISKTGRATQGVRVMRVSEGDSVVSAAKIIKE